MLGRTARLAAGPRLLSQRLRHRQLRPRRPGAARHRRDRRGDPRRPRPTDPGVVPRLGARADKRFPLTSPEIEREVGGRIKEARGWHVDLAEPALTIHVEALTHEAFYFFGKERGAGGLPVGASGRVACLLSGGIDSPVAAWRMMRRGCRVRVRPLPQLSDPVARVAGEGARAGAAAHRVPVPNRGCCSCRSARSSSRSCCRCRRRCGS